MISIPIEVGYADGRRTNVVARGVTQVAFERRFHTGFIAAFSDQASMRVEHVYFIAWHASRPMQLDFDEWLETVDEIVMGSVKTVDPTQPAASAD